MANQIIDDLKMNKTITEEGEKKLNSNLMALKSESSTQFTPSITCLMHFKNFFVIKVFYCFRYPYSATNLWNSVCAFKFTKLIPTSISFVLEKIPILNFTNFFFKNMDFPFCLYVFFISRKIMKRKGWSKYMKNRKNNYFIIPREIIDFILFYHDAEKSIDLKYILK